MQPRINLFFRKTYITRQINKENLFVCTTPLFYQTSTNVKHDDMRQFEVFDTKHALTCAQVISNIKHQINCSVLDLCNYTHQTKCNIGVRYSLSFLHFIIIHSAKTGAHSSLLELEAAPRAEGHIDYQY